LGLAGLLVPEDHGGVGASAREAAVVLEELGRTVAPLPFLTSAVVATTLLLDAGTELLPALAAGSGPPRSPCYSRRPQTARRHR
jgi:alkylation response protein AidB-like acyl-CoA dehydrogenase